MENLNLNTRKKLIIEQIYLYINKIKKTKKYNFSRSQSQGPDTFYLYMLRDIKYLVIGERWFTSIPHIHSTTSLNKNDIIDMNSEKELIKLLHNLILNFKICIDFDDLERTYEKFRDNIISIINRHGIRI